MADKNLRFLVVDGNTRDGRETHRATYGMAYCESYAAVIREIEIGLPFQFALMGGDGASGWMARKSFTFSSRIASASSDTGGSIAVSASSWNRWFCTMSRSAPDRS